MRTTRNSSRLLGRGGVCLSACWDASPGIGLDPPGLGLDNSQVLAWTPPSVVLDTNPPGVGLDTPLARPLNQNDRQV